MVIVDLPMVTLFASWSLQPGSTSYLLLKQPSSTTFSSWHSSPSFPPPIPSSSSIFWCTFAKDTESWQWDPLQISSWCLENTRRSCLAFRRLFRFGIVCMLCSLWGISKLCWQHWAPFSVAAWGWQRSDRIDASRIALWSQHLSWFSWPSGTISSTSSLWMLPEWSELRWIVFCMPISYSKQFRGLCHLAAGIVSCARLAADGCQSVPGIHE